MREQFGTGLDVLDQRSWQRGAISRVAIERVTSFAGKVLWKQQMMDGHLQDHFGYISERSRSDFPAVKHASVADYKFLLTASRQNTPKTAARRMNQGLVQMFEFVEAFQTALSAEVLPLPTLRVPEALRRDWRTHAGQPSVATFRAKARSHSLAPTLRGIHRSTHVF